MTMYRRKPITISASIWNALGDHPDVAQLEMGEGACEACSSSLANHGKIDGATRDRVCPGDWVITNESGVVFALSSDQFADMYEAVP
jgi:hypothetical protein